MLGGAEVAVRHGHLIICGQIPVPAVRQGLRLHPSGDDPDVFLINLPGPGSGTAPVVFSAARAARSPPCTWGSCPSFGKRPGMQNPRPWATGALGAGALALAPVQFRGCSTGS